MRTARAGCSQTRYIGQSVPTGVLAGVRLKNYLLAATCAALVAAPLASADHVPINWSLGPGHVGLWVETVTTTNHPVNLQADRSTGTFTALSWDPPTHTDGRTLVGYFVYRALNVPGDQPLVNTYIADGGVTSMDDTSADFDASYVYFVTALFEDATGEIRTESVASMPIFVNPFLSGYPHCNTPNIDLGTFPYATVNLVCIIP